ncbi:hypothetical protein FCJ61_38205 [Burkholderia metallica]|nr:hypothetical protein [Burkholderia metallica]
MARPGQPHRSAGQVARATTTRHVRGPRPFRFRRCRRCRCRCRRNASTRRHPAPESVILEMPTTRVLAGLRIRHDDFGIYQGNRRYADIVAGRASNAQDARIFAT